MNFGKSSKMDYNLLCLRFSMKNSRMKKNISAKIVRNYKKLPLYILRKFFFINLIV